MNFSPVGMVFGRQALLLYLLLTFFLVFQFLPAHALPTVDTTFLSSNVNSDGSLAMNGDLSEPYKSTAEALITFEVLGQQNNAVVNPALTYLGSTSVESTEDLSLRLLVSPLSDPEFSSILAQINQRQNTDGGVGAFPNFGSDLLSSAYLLRVLSRAGIANETLGRLVGYLLNQQNADGSWSIQDNPNRIEITAIVTNALWLHRQTYQLGNALTDGVNYLVDQRATNNLWDEIEASALALSAILNVAVDRTPYQSSLTAFADLQNSNGSFANDVYLTALGLRIIDATQKPAPDEIRLSGRVVEGDSGTALAGAAIVLSGPDSLSQVADVNGEFVLENLTAGTYALTVSIDGFS